MRTLAMSGHKCKESLDESSASLLLMHAFRQLRNRDACNPCTPCKHQAAPSSPLTALPVLPGRSSMPVSSTPVSSTPHVTMKPLPRGSCTGVATRVHTVALVGATLIAGAATVKGRTASETYDNYRELSSALLSSLHACAVGVLGSAACLPPLPCLPPWV